MLFNHFQKVRYLFVVFGIACGAAFGLLTLLSIQSAAAAEAPTCFATINGITVFADTTAKPVQDAINAANENDLIRVAGSCVGVNNQNGTSQTALITKSVTLEGGYLQTNWNATPDPSLYPTILDAAGAGRVVLIPDEGAFTVTLSNLQVTNGVEQASSGGGVLVSGDHNLLIRNTQIYSNTSDNDGGGISISVNGQVMMDNVQVYGNSTGDDGGGVHMVNGAATIANSVIVDNIAQDGGGLDIKRNGVVTVTHSLIERNVASGDGGGIVANGSLWLLHSSVSENQGDDQAALDGDAEADVIIIHGTTISGNVSADVGGNIEFVGADNLVHISDSLIQNNQVLDGTGAGLENEANMLITNTQIIGNFASDDCGGIFNEGQMTLTNVTISGNQAQKGGGLCLDGDGSSLVIDSRIENNVATQTGGGVDLLDAENATLIGTTIANNQAAQGGGLFSENSQLTLINSTVSGNQADEAGIFAQTEDASTQFIHTTLANNSAMITDTGMSILSGTVFLTNSILADNGAANCVFGDGTLVSGNYNLEDGDSCGLTEPSDQTNTDPLLDALADNGGPTPTHALLAGSPAIDAIPNGAGGCGVEFVSDQRGQARPFGAGCDIGAFERGQLFTLSITLAGTGSGTVTSDPAGIDCVAACAADFEAGTEVTLTAVADPGSLFTGWQGACTNLTGDCVVTMDQARSVTAIFEEEIVEFKVFLPLILNE